MLNLPKTTEFNKRIPKSKFYEKLSITPELKRVFIDQIKSVIWRNKISPDTANIQKGDKVTEVEVFEVQLSGKELDPEALEIMDQNIPYHLVFVLHYDNQIKVLTSYKELKNKTGNQYRVRTYFSTPWLPENEFSLILTGLNLDSVYENIVRTIAGDQLHQISEESLDISVERAERIKELKAKIEKLKSKMRKEKQFNKRTILSKQVKKLKIELLNLENGKDENEVSEYAGKKY